MGTINANVPGVNGIVGFTTQDPTASPEEMHGGPANPAHAVWGEQAEPYSWESQLMNYDGSLHGQSGDYVTATGSNVALGAGNLGQDPQADLGPSAAAVGGSHAAVRTRTLSGPLPSQYDAINYQLDQSRDMHASNLGSSRQNQLSQQGLSIQQDDWSEDWAVEPGTSNLTTNVPAQLRGATAGFGTRDREQSFAPQNQYGFDSPHLHRRAANGSIPGNYMYLKPGSRPLVKTIAGPSRPPVGDDSPFSGQNTMTTFGIQGAVLQTLPSQYSAVPVPNLAPPVQGSSDSIDPISLW
jgi:hypothetical protein